MQYIDKASLYMLMMVFCFAVVSVGVCSETLVYHITLRDEACGGDLILFLVNGGADSPTIRVATEKGASATEVLELLAKLAAQDRRFISRTGYRGSRDESGLRFSGYRPGYMGFAGTETCLGIPKPLASLSPQIVYVGGKEHVTLHWEGEMLDGDQISVLGENSMPVVIAAHNGMKSVQVPLASLLPEDTQFMIDLYVSIFRSGVPSPPAVVSLMKRGPGIRESMDIPFYDGIAPNWLPWGNDNGTLLLEEGVEVGMDRRETVVKNRYQAVRASDGASGGLLRRFIGMKSNSTYRISVDVNTLASRAGNWRLSFHVARNEPDGSFLTDAQLLGEAELPDGQVGLQAGLFGQYGELVTDDMWATNETYSGEAVSRFRWHDRSGPRVEQVCGDLFLPEGNETFTVWCRLQSEGPVPAMAFDNLQVQLLDEATP